MNKLKPVDFSNLTVADLVRNLPKGYELYSPAYNVISFLSIEEDGSIKCIDRKGRVIYFDEKGRLHEEGECMLYPHKSMKIWTRFYAPAKDEEVIYCSSDNSLIIHIAGKWFMIGDTFKEVEPVYEPRSVIISEEDEPTSIENQLGIIEDKLKLKLNLDTLEWAEVKEEEFILSDGSKAKEGDEVIVIDNFIGANTKGEETMSWTVVLLKTKYGTNYSYVCSAGVGYEYALPKKGNEWRIGGNSKLDDTEPNQEIIFSDGSVAHEGDEILVCDCTIKWRARKLLGKESREYPFKTSNANQELYYWEYAIPKAGNESVIDKYFQPWHIGKKWPNGLRTGEPCLVKDNKYDEWCYSIYSHHSKMSCCAKAVDGRSWQYCIPYNGNEHLVGTNEEPKI